VGLVAITTSPRTYLPSKKDRVDELDVLLSVAIHMCIA